MENQKVEVSNKRVMLFLWAYAWRDKLSVVLIAISSIAGTLAVVLIPIAVKRMIDAMSNNLGYAEALKAFYLYIGLVIASDITHRIGSIITSKFQPKVMASMHADSLEYIIGHSYQFFSDNFVGSISRKIARLGRAFERIFDEFQFKFVPACIILAGSFIGIFSALPLLGWIFLLWVVIFLIFNQVATKIKLPHDILRAEQDSKVGGATADILANAIPIKVFTGFKFESKYIRELTEVWRRLYVKGWMIGEVSYGAQAILMTGLQAVMFYYAIKYWSLGKISVGDVALIQAYMMTVFGRLWDIGRGIRNLYEGIADAKELVEILDAPHEISDKIKAKKLKVTKGSIEFKDVSFYYNDTRKIFDDLNLKFNQGEKVALIGTSGAGKTTITKLLMRFYNLTSGKIFIDDQDISDVTQESLRSFIGYVPQDPVLFHRTLIENIRYGNQDASDEEVFEAARKSQCHEFITALEDGYETYVGERGVKLSGGERQRIAIARAILKNAPILILDEATSSLDSESEQLIQKALKELMKNKTTIVIAHRLSTIMQMDRIVVIEEGEVIDQGTHDELLTREGKYKKLWDIQAGGFIS